jgi:hypothetical protein
VGPFRRGATIASAPLLLLLVGASSGSALDPGLWELRNTPGVATLDGRPLKDLPLGPIKTDRMCLTPSQAASPAQFLIRDLGQACTVESSTVARGRLRIAGRCPNQVEGPDGRFELSGKYRRNSYDVRFATTAIGENGRMTFSGRMTGKRVGACPTQ